MTRRSIFSLGLALVFFGVLLGVAAPAAASDDPLLVKPVVLVVIDTSGSMERGKTDAEPGDWGYEPFDCGVNGDLECTRMDLIKEVLTGSYPADGKHCYDPANPQERDGILDKYRSNVRFALGSFDADYNYWNYASFRYGIKPRNGDGCSGDECLQDFLDKNEPGNTEGHNDSLQGKVCNYDGSGWTPLGAVLHDAEHYLEHWQDEIDYEDHFWECRPKFVILFTDGKEECAAWMNCFSKGRVEDNASGLFSSGIENVLPEVYWPGKESGVPTFIVGMGDRDNPGDYPGIDIAELDAAATAGTGGIFPQAFMADNATELRAQFDAILSIILSGSSSRTDLAAQSSMAYNKGYQFKAYFDVTEAGPWAGHLVREEITDANGDGVPEYVGDPLLFEEKLADQNPNDRNIYTIYDDPRSRVEPLFRTMEPFKSGVRASPTGSDDSLMCLPDSPKLPKDDDDDKDVSEDKYADYVKDFVRGVAGKKNINRSWKTDGSPWLGDIFHATPVAVAPPSSLAPDYKFEAYFLNNRERPTMVYAGANDGMLHAFVGEDLDDYSQDGKEAWAFIPTKTLSIIQETRGMHRQYVDSTPIVRDVYFNDLQEVDHNGDDLAVKGAYRTVLMGGVRGGGAFYYAIDVTDPDEPRYLWEYRTNVSVEEDGGGDPQYPYTDPEVQCKQDFSQTWAKPIIGQIWVKRADDDEYQARSVAMIPGGFLPGNSFGNIGSCIELIEMTVFPTTLHIIDIETGKLLKKYTFTEAGVYDDMLAALEDYYELIASGNTNPWNQYSGGCDRFKTDDYDPVANTGWGCAEKRANVQNPPAPPDELMDDHNCWECPEDIDCDTLGSGITYAKICCSNPTKTDVCKECSDDGDCSTNKAYYCHEGECKKRSTNTVCDQPCGDAADPPCGSCNSGICEDSDTCHDEYSWGDCEKQEVTIASKCDTPDMKDLNAVKNCSWRYMEYDDGSKDYWLKTEGCWLVDNEDQGRLCYHVGGNFTLNGVAAHPVAYNTSFGEFITRAFMPTTTGVMWRMDLSNGLYDPDADEGSMIESYDDTVNGDTATYGWNFTEFFDIKDVEDPENAPDTIPTRPIMAPPALGLTYNRSLVLFFGTGRTDDLEYYNERDYFFAVEETLDADGLPVGTGQLFHRDGPAAATAMKFPEGERVFGKPLVAAGKVILTTFVANPSKCKEGTSNMHIFHYDDLPADTSSALQTYATGVQGTPSSPAMVWTPTGPVVLAQQGKEVVNLPVADAIKPTAHALHWGQVL